MARRWRLGVDIGGTFTDLSLMDEDTGQVVIGKTASVPQHPERAVITGIRELMAEHGIDPADIQAFVHGTTIATNTVIERTGARTGLLVTKGFRDILNIARLRLPNVWDLLTEKPEPLVRRKCVREIDQRILANGTVYRELSDAEVLREATFLVREGVEAVAIAFLHAYVSPAHEERAKAIIARAFPDLYVCTSAETWPQMREYERTLVTVINAYVGKRMEGYFSGLQREARAIGLRATLLTTKSNGGIMTAETARRVPVETLLSGPASGVVGAAFVGKQAGFEKLITLDMGGTSADVAVVEGEIRFSVENHVGDFPVILPAVDINSIGAGGGSIAWTDRAGVLKVGPRSAGADPGPACYNQGGTEPTVTDAYVVMGLIDPDRFLGGRLRLHPDRARQAIARVGRVLGLDPDQAAESIIRVATSTMYAELVSLMARKGIDASEFALLAYGGAGATHAGILAREVGIGTIVIPRYPGILCAIGCLVSDVKSDFVKTVYRAVPSGDGQAVMADLAREWAALEGRALQWLESERIPVREKMTMRSADMRYLGQSFEINVPLPGQAPGDGGDGRQLLEAFHRRYRALYGQSDEAAPVEVIDLRTTVVGTTPKPALALVGKAPDGQPACPASPIGSRQILFEGQTLLGSVHEREALREGHVIEGPAIIHQFDTTTFLPPGLRASVDRFGNIIARR
jgi:N-methylhydantoinase A